MRHFGDNDNLCGHDRWQLFLPCAMSGARPMFAGSYNVPACWRVVIVLLPSGITLVSCQSCRRTAMLAVVNWNNNAVTEYPLIANGNATPTATLVGSDTGRDLPFGNASDSV